MISDFDSAEPEVPEQKTILLAADFHRKHGDKAGAEWWENQEK